MKAFMLVAMLIGLLVTAWLVFKDLQAQQQGVSGPAVIKPIERAAEARRTIEGADKLREDQLGKAAGE
jgi:hypothetical protein